MKVTHPCLVTITSLFIKMANRFIFHLMREQVCLRIFTGLSGFFVVVVILWIKYQSLLFFRFWVVFAGSGFVSHDLYLHGFFSASIKLPADYTAGVVVAFYVSFSSNLFPFI